MVTEKEEKARVHALAWKEETDIYGRKKADLSQDFVYGVELGRTGMKVGLC